MPFLPPPLQLLMLQEHEALERDGFPEDAVARHAAWEEPLFRLYCPDWVCARLEEDHRAHAEGGLMSREPQNWRARWRARAR